MVGLDKNEPSSDLFCSECNRFYEVKTWWMDYGTYSVKLAKCPDCEKTYVLKYQDSAGLKVNTDKRFYTYR